MPSDDLKSLLNSQPVAPPVCPRCGMPVWVLYDAGAAQVFACVGCAKE